MRHRRRKSRNTHLAFGLAALVGRKCRKVRMADNKSPSATTKSRSGRTRISGPAHGPPASRSNHANPANRPILTGSKGFTKVRNKEKERINQFAATVQKCDLLRS